MPATLYLLEFLLGICAVIVIVNQAIVPMIKGLPVFPFFRKTRKLSGELTNVNGEVEDMKLKREITAKRKLIKDIRKKL